ncbi:MULTISPECIES: hypothetical protein [unclassified Gemella]|uniref:hypothetical protein n=1 Tax=unclassified Gemella TaxID=2624949 RepID=UPI001C05DECE|nr:MULTISPECIES: hypothetical protein [unclassified Gemella]MBU0278273.1 hypothetical protein [Gemella sp. zg-1178]QWQ38220.1 hypothetical protein KMP11_04430 [Gemella sp. zg-570]
MFYKKYIIIIPSIIYVISAYLYINICKVLEINYTITHIDIFAISVLILVFNFIFIEIMKRINKKGKN